MVFWRILDSLAAFQPDENGVDAGALSRHYACNREPIYETVSLNLALIICLVDAKTNF